MLKHASNAGPAANGQLRNNPPPPPPPLTTIAAAVTTSPIALTAATVARNIHLRPQQPLNISTLNALTTAAAPTSTTTTAAAATSHIANGGHRLPTSASTTTLLNIATPNGPSTGTTATTTPVTPITPITPNGISNNLHHTYTNQLLTATPTSIGNNNAHHLTSQHLQHNSHHSIAPNHINNTSINHHNYSNCNNLTGVTLKQSKHGPGPREALTSLGLLCLVSLLFALLSLIFLLKISPSGRDDAFARSPTDDFVIVYDITLALCALSLSLNLCCLLVCAIQFLFAVKLVRSPMFDGRDNKYLEKSSASRTCAVGGFFISIPLFLTGIILYTFNHFHSTPAIITSVLIGIGIVFCGAAMVHNVFVWQKEKTISYRSPPLNMSFVSQIGPITPPVQFLTHHQLSPQQQQQHHHHHASAAALSAAAPPLPPPHHANSFNQSNMLTLPLQLQHPTSITPVSPNHSHGSFSPLGCGAINSSFLIRPATATPPTPKPLNNAGGCNTTMNGGREAAGSVSPGLPGLDMSNITNTSLHELSTLV